MGLYACMLISSCMPAGDLACWSEDGSVHILGRIDRQVKVRGMRIELGEIEAVLAGCKGVKSASVKVVNNALTKQATIVAYLHPESLDPRGVITDARKKLPKHMAPQATVLMTSMPLMPSGKVNQVALPEPKWEAGAEGDTFVEPRSDLERRIHDVWVSVLGTEHISVEADFFEAGGTSMLAGGHCFVLDHKFSTSHIPDFTKSVMVENDVIVPLQAWRHLYACGWPAMFP